MTRFLLATASVLSAACDADEGACALDADVSSIDDAVDTLNQLPSPVTLPCFLTSLPRPLGLELTSNVFSLQPAQGRESPRIFVRNAGLTLSVVPAGPGAHLLEFGEVLPSGLSLKAEVAFPVQGTLTRADTFARTLDSADADFTSCGVCHALETEVAPGEYASVPLRPTADKIVPLDMLRAEHEACRPSDDPDRCEMLSALFDHGPVEHAPFPDDIDALTNR